MPTTEEMPRHPCSAPPTAAPEEIIMEEGLVEMVPKHEAPVAHEVILADAEPQMLQPYLYYTIVTPGFEAKLNAHIMCDQESSLHT
jgi:hypothetical protein